MRLVSLIFVGQVMGTLADATKKPLMKGALMREGTMQPCRLEVDADGTSNPSDVYDSNLR